LLVIVFISLLIPTALMGISLPLLSKALVRNIENAASLISLLYGVNTLGAGIGTVMSGWFLVGTLGYEGAVYLGAALSAGVGLVTLWAASQFATDDRTLDKKLAIRLEWRNIPRSVWGWCFLVFVSGFIVISLELVWFRVLDVTLRSNAYTFAHLLFFFLVGDALGSIVGARFIHRIDNPRRAFLWIQGLVVLYAVVIIWLISIAADAYPLSQYLEAPSVKIELVLQDNLITWFVYLFLPFIMLFPPAFLIGFYFPIVQKAVQTDAEVVGQRVGLVDVANIIGNAMGSILTGTVLLHFLGTAGSLRLLTAMGLVFVGLLILENFQQFKLGYRVASGSLALALVVTLVAFPSGNQLWAQLHGAADDELFIVAESSSGVAAIREENDVTGIYANGVHQGNIPITVVHGLLGALPSLIHPQPERVMVIGIGSAGTPYSVGVNQAIDEIVAVEIIGSEIDVLEAYSNQERGGVFDTLLNDPRYNIVVGDGRRELALSEAKFDIIEADAIRPYSSHSGLLYSREFFELAREQLADGGIMAQWNTTERAKRTF
jgi:predicted membrane-bound spermidine synthase